MCGPSTLPYSLSSLPSSTFPVLVCLQDSAGVSDVVSSMVMIWSHTSHIGSILVVLSFCVDENRFPDGKNETISGIFCLF